MKENMAAGWEEIVSERLVESIREETVRAMLIDESHSLLLLFPEMIGFFFFFRGFSSHSIPLLLALFFISLTLAVCVQPS
jgi:hypothetical protein